MVSGVEEVPVGFKMTELGIFPADWFVYKFENLIEDVSSGDWGNEITTDGCEPCCVIRGTDFKTAINSSLVAVPIRFIRSSSIAKRHLNPGDILVELSGGSKDQPTGRVLLISGALIKQSLQPLLFSNFVKRLRLNLKCIPEFFQLYWDYRYMNGATRTYEKRTTGIRNFKLNDFLGNESVPVPPIPEQRAIAHVLFTIQRAIEVHDKVITAARELKKSLMRYLFTYGSVPINEINRVELKETDIGLMPTYFIIKSLKEVGEIITGSTPRTSHPEYYIGPYMFISPGDMGEVKYVEKTGKYLSEKGINVSRALPRDTVLVVCIGATIGKTAMTYAEKSATNQQINSIISNSKTNSHYLYYAIGHLAHLLPAIAGRAAIPIVNKSNFSGFLIPLPPLPEQQQIADILSSIDKKIQIEENRKASLQTLFKTMLRLLMTGQLRVKDLQLEN
jgi:type I restriction enzyme S subunit